MCDFFWEKRGASTGGDLSDIIRSAQTTVESQSATWQLQTGSSIVADPSSSSSNGFSDPFQSLREALFEEVQENELFEEMKSSRVSSGESRVSLDGSRVSALVSSGDDMAKIGGVFMRPIVPSDLRGTGPGIKRRKGETKKVVCIPAPVAIGATSANGRLTSGSEVVPSDLWAWRKYGQKPIKGSPYPRGYYRCSSSKGCSARKQVERSRTDPNMLVITYTSEHNHPWPTHRNALAGSTRGHISKSLSSYPKNTNMDSMFPNLVPSQVSATINVKDSEISKSIIDNYNTTRVELSNEILLKQETVEMGLLEPESDPDEKVIMDPFSLFNWFGEK